MVGKKQKLIWLWLASAIGLSAVVVTSTCIGVLAGTNFAAMNLKQSPLPLHAGTAVTGKSMSMATGLIDDQVEGLYVLDHVSGNLQCWTLNARTGAVGGVYRANVAADLVADKTGVADYVMTTGNFFYDGGVSGNLVPAKSVVYVADVTTGNVVGYGLAYDKQADRRGVVQAGELKVMCKGASREIMTRDQ